MDAIPLVDLKAAHAHVADEVLQGFSRVLANTSFIMGADVTEFEKEFAAFTQVNHCVGVANGTDALELALRAVGIGPGDEVIVPVNTFIATALAVHRAGATPVFIDCDPVHLLIDPSKIAPAITPRTRAIMPVHLYGQVAPMAEVLRIAQQHKLLVIEDSAQSQGAKQHGKNAGTFGIAAGTSFYPGKNLGAYGDAGAVVTNDPALDTKLRAIRNYGSVVKYHHPEQGFNSRLDTLQAVVLRAKLKKLAHWNQQRRDAAARYDRMLAGLAKVRIVPTVPGNEPIYHLYVIRVPNRDSVLKQLNAAGVGAGIHYPTPLHLTGAFASLGYKAGSFPAAEQSAGEILSLPMYPEITEAQQQRVVAELSKALG